MYQESEIIGIAKRENNQKRRYLVVNRLQGKHVPASPTKSLAMFQALAEEIGTAYAGERVLFIGFAETATAVGAAVAEYFHAPYMQTTREAVPGVRFFYFSEEHSHATEQKLVWEDLAARAGALDRIVFVEDEVTTGRTILHLVHLLWKEFPNIKKYSVASLINGMDAEALRRYQKLGISLHYLLKTDHSGYGGRAAAFLGDGALVTDAVYAGPGKALDVEEMIFPCGRNPRRYLEPDWYGTALRRFLPFCEERGRLYAGKRVLVLGTEELMYPALWLGRELEKYGCLVKSHSTTRSPILPSCEEAYPLHKRYALKSLYDRERKTFLYDIGTYDWVLVVTDAPEEETEGLQSLFSALSMEGNQNICLIRWRPDGDGDRREKWRAPMRTSYRKEDVTLLLKDITGMVRPQSTEERERLIQSGRHYCEMLPIEYVPTQAYMQVYAEALAAYAKVTAAAVAVLSDRIVARRGKDVVLVSLARAGTPVGILLKWYIRRKYRIAAPHYSISIIRGRGIDRNAMQYLLERYRPAQLVFVDGWIGKGAILRELEQALLAYPGVSPEIAVLADPANVTALCGTHADILIPSACLNCTVSGLVSRTFFREDIIGPEDFHGAVYYGELKDADLSYAFLDAVAQAFPMASVLSDAEVPGTGLEEVLALSETYGVADLNRIKPGIGETTRVLLRRVPWKILVDEKYRDSPALRHIFRLAEEKAVPVEFCTLRHYKCCGIIRKMADA